LQEAGEDCIMRSFIACTLHKILLGLSKSRWSDGRACSTHGEIRNVYKILVGKPEGKRPLTGPRRRWEDNTGTNVGELGWQVVDWIQLAHDRDQWQAVVKMLMNLRAPKCLKISWLAEWLLASQEGPRSTGWIR
jgi:hypothetical protein